jgi:DNA-binding CsgD family transcriptional regulator
MTDAKDLLNQGFIIPSPGSSTNQFAEPWAADSALRNSGIPFTNGVPWGVHLCLFYETSEDLLDAVAGYLRAGLESNELCVWAVTSPITVQDAKKYLRRAIHEFDEHLLAGQIEILDGNEWYLIGDHVDSKRIIRGWSEKLSGALTKGYDGMRVTGNAFWLGTRQWKEFCHHEQELDKFLVGRKILALCTYSIDASSAVDILDVMRAHQFSLARRNGAWQLLETSEFKQAKREIKKLNDAVDIGSKPFAGNRALTQRERMVLAQIVRGVSSKEAARALGVAPRTIEFHRANIMRKLGAKNTVDLVRKVLAA